MKAISTKAKLILGIIVFTFLLTISVIPDAKGEEVQDDSIHTYAYRTTRSITEGPGDQMGCMTSGISYTFWFDVYYTGNVDDDERVTELVLNIQQGSSWVEVGGVAWSYNSTGDPMSYAFTGSGDNIDVPYSGKNGPGQLTRSEPHTTIRCTFVTGGSLGQQFYYQIWGIAYKFTDGQPYQPASFSTCYFWYEICYVPNGVPEFPVELPVMTSLGFALLYGVRRRQLNAH
jgi:hypothetical protein